MYKPKIKVRGKHGDKPDKSELYDKYCRTSHEVRGLKFQFTILYHKCKPLMCESIENFWYLHDYRGHGDRCALVLSAGSTLKSDKLQLCSVLCELLSNLTYLELLL